MLASRRPTHALTLVALLAACASEDVERSKEVVEEKFDEAREKIGVAGAELGRKGKEGLREANEGLRDAGEGLREAGEGLREASRDAGEGLREAGRGAGEGLRDASEGLDQWIAEARKEDPAYQPIPGAAEAIICEKGGERCTMSAKFIDQLGRDPTVLANEAVVSLGPASQGKGLVLGKVKPGSIPALLGLQDADVLVSLNGTNLASLDAPRALADALAGTDLATLVLERAGKRKSIQIVRLKS